MWMAVRRVQDVAERLIAQVETRLSVNAARVGEPVAVGALSLGASTPVTVPFAPAVVGANYAVVPTLYGATGLIGNLSVVGVTARAEGSVTVLVKAPLLAVGAGASLGVTIIPKATA